MELFVSSKQGHPDRNKVESGVHNELEVHDLVRSVPLEINDFLN